MVRDNFNEDVKRRLSLRVGSRCSNPDCRVPTTASSGSNSVTNIGVAAHICAASPGGPRYDDTMTSEQRKSFSNGIWLCNNCSTKIDRDVNLYPSSLLKDWKDRAEKKSISELGRMLPSDDYATDLMVQALSGNIKKLLPNAINNIHKAGEIALENLDDRFEVKSNFVNGFAQYYISPKKEKTVPIKFKIDKEKSKIFEEKMKKLISGGDDLLIETSGISVSGSKLFEEIFSDGQGVMKMSPMRLESTLRFILKEPKTNKIEIFDDLKGSLRYGRESYTFEGSTWSGLLNCTVNGSIDNTSTKLSISIDERTWEGQILSNLLYYNKVKKFFTLCSQGWHLLCSLEANGNEVFSSTEISIGDESLTKEQIVFFEYIDMATKITKELGTSLIYKTGEPVYQDTFNSLKFYERVIDGKEKFKEPPSYIPIKFQINFGEDPVGLAKDFAKPEGHEVKIIQNPPKDFVVFGQKIALPKVKMLMSPMSIIPEKKIRRRDINKDLYVNLKPMKNFIYEAMLSDE